MKNLKLLGNNESNVSEFLNVPKEEGICQWIVGFKLILAKHITVIIKLFKKLLESN